MELKKFINSVIFVDDSFDEIKKGVEFFQKQGIWTMHINPNELDLGDYSFINTTVIFLDIEYQPGFADVKRAINVLRDLTKENYPYVLVLWTKHTSKIDEVNQIIDNKLDNKPIKVIELEKTVLLGESVENFEKSLEEEFIDFADKNKMTSQLLKWKNQSLCSINETVKSLYSLFDSAPSEDQLANVLFCMCEGTLEENNVLSSFKIINNVLIDNILKNMHSELDDMKIIENKQPDSDDGKYKLKINKMILFEDQPIKHLMPGVLYSTDTEIDNSLVEKLNIGVKCIEKYLIDITPSCTFKKEDVSVVVDAYILKSIDSKILGKLSNLRKNYINIGCFEINGDVCTLIVNALSIKNINRKKEELVSEMRLRNEIKNALQIEVMQFLSRLGNSSIVISKNEITNI